MTGHLECRGGVLGWFTAQGSGFRSGGCSSGGLLGAYQSMHCNLLKWMPDWVATKMIGNATTGIGNRIVPVCHRRIATSSSSSSSSSSCSTQVTRHLRKFSETLHASCNYHATIATNGSTFTFGIDGLILNTTTITVAWPLSRRPRTT